MLRYIVDLVRRLVDQHDVESGEVLPRIYHNIIYHNILQYLITYYNMLDYTILYYNRLVCTILRILYYYY